MLAGPLRILPYVGSFFALVAHFFDFFTHLKSSCIFDKFFGVLARFFEVLGGSGEGFWEVFSWIFGDFFEVLRK